MLRKKNAIRLLCTALCAVLLCACSAPAEKGEKDAATQAPSPSVLDASAAAQSGGESLPEGQLSLMRSVDAASGRQYGPIILSGDKLIYRAQSGTDAFLLTDIASGTAAYYAVGESDGYGGVKYPTVYSASGRAVYVCGAGQEPIFVYGGWLLAGVLRKNGAYTASSFVNLATGEVQKGPEGVCAQNAEGYGVIPQRGFWLEQQGENGCDVHFYDTERNELAVAENQTVVGFIGDTVYLRPQAAAAKENGETLAETAIEKTRAVSALDLATGRAGGTLPEGTLLYRAGCDDYMVLTSDGNSTVYDAHGAETAKFAGYCLFYNGKMAVLSTVGPAESDLKEVENGGCMGDGLTLVQPDGTAETILSAAWNTRSCGLAAAGQNGISVYGADGVKKYDVEAQPAACRYTLIADYRLAVESATAETPFTALYGGSGLLWKSAEYRHFHFVDGSSVPIAWDVQAAGTKQALILQNGSTIVGQLDDFQPLSDTRILVRQGSAFGLVDAGGRWLWSLT